MIGLLAVFIGGGIGSVLRYLMSLFYFRFFDMNLPLATLSVNVVGSFILGALLALFPENTAVNQSTKLALTVGFCGGFTTFSSFSFEVFDLLKRGDFLMAFIYAVISFVTCVGIASVGFYWAKSYV